MSQTDGRSYRIREFAKLAGVTVRALHHYDRLGLLEPQRSAAGYRIYGRRDLETLEQIVALKFIGLPLTKIKLLLRGGAVDLGTALRAQRRLLEHKKRQLEQAIAAIRDAETMLESSGAAESRLVRRIIEVIEMQNKGDEWKTRYDALVQEKLERLKVLSPEEKTELHDRFAALFKQAAGLIEDDPAGPRAQELAARYVDLLRTFTHKNELDPQLQKIVAAFLAGGEWPAGAPPEPPFGGRRVWEFMSRALAARG
jgi:DNA-binding transcriptional MerR regulator